MSVSIRHLSSPKPTTQLTYAVFCNHHRIITTVTRTPSVVRKWITAIRYHHYHHLRNGRLIVGVGVQWTPGESQAATLQLCVGNRCLVFQLEYADRSPAVLRRLLCDSDVILVGIWNHRDKEMLMESSHRLKVRRLVDVRHVAAEKRGCGGRVSMGRLAEEVLGFVGVEKDTEVATSAWDVKWLSEDQVEYAVVDAFVCFMIAKKLRVWKYGYDN